MKQNSYTDLERLHVIAERFRESGTVVVPTHKDWVTVAMGCASLGEAARQDFHLICQSFEGYSYEESDPKFTNCLKTTRGEVRLGSIIQFARDCGIDTSMPRGRRQKTEEQCREEQRTLTAQVADRLRQYADWRFNTWQERPEFREAGTSRWQELREQDLDTFYIRLKMDGLRFSKQDTKSMLWSRDFSEQFDVCQNYLNHLKPWNPDSDPDYIGDLLDHLLFQDDSRRDFYHSMLRKWFLCMVAMMRRQESENPLVPIFSGGQDIGKSYVARRILPPQLQSYKIEVSPAQLLDKDYLASLSDTPLMLFDELDFGGRRKANTLKHTATMSETNIRQAYGLLREKRVRRASLIATTNDEQFLPDIGGNRRWLVIGLKGTVDLNEHPINYDGAYGQAVYLLNHGVSYKPTHEENRQNTDFNHDYLLPNDCEEALKTFLRQPSGLEPAVSLSAGDLLSMLHFKGFTGRGFNVFEIGRAMNRMGFEKKKIKGVWKYLVVKIDQTSHDLDNKKDAEAFIPDLF